MFTHSHTDLTKTISESGQFNKMKKTRTDFLISVLISTALITKVQITKTVQILNKFKFALCEIIGKTDSDSGKISDCMTWFQFASLLVGCLCYLSSWPMYRISSSFSTVASLPSNLPQGEGKVSWCQCVTTLLNLEQTKRIISHHHHLPLGLGTVSSLQLGHLANNWRLLNSYRTGWEGHVN